MAVSNTFKGKAFARETDEAFILLLTLSHADLAEPIRVCSDSADVVSGGDTFTAFPFELLPPNDSDDSPPQASLKIDNVDRSIVQAIRTITSPPTLLMEIVLASDPDTIEVTWNDFTLVDVEYDALVVAGNLVQEDFTVEPYPALTMNPADFPAIF